MCQDDAVMNLIKMHMQNFASLFLVLLVSVVFGLNDGNVLIIPFPCANYWYRAAYLTKEIKLIGYDAIVVLPDVLLAKRILSGLHADIIISEGMTKSFNIFETAAKHAALGGFNGVKMTGYDDSRTKEICPNIASDEILLQELRKRDIEVAVLAVSSSNLCVSVVPYKLSIPFIRLEDTIYDMGVSNALQIHPGAFPAHLFSPFCDKMTYIERLVNTLYYFHLIIYPDVYDSNPSNIIGTLAPEKKTISNDELQSKTELYLLEHDELLDYNLPTYENVIHVGGLVTRPADKLPVNLEVFMDSGKGGVVIVSFGSIVTSIPHNVENKIIGVIRRLPQLKFVFKCDTCAKKTSIKNVLFIPWIPQNDLLGHRNTKVFISHCGMNAQYEALYHAVPMICLPVYSDQYYNSIRIKSKGYGSILDVATFTENELKAEIIEVLQSPVYRQNIFNASAIFRNRPLTPTKRAAWWIDHIIKYGGRHLKPPIAQFQYYQLLLIDVLAGLILICMALFLACVCVVTTVARVLRVSREKTKQE